MRYDTTKQQPVVNHKSNKRENDNRNLLNFKETDGIIAAHSSYGGG